MTSRPTSADVSRGDRRCGWCRSRIRATARGDAVYCSQSCRQAAHRTRIRRVELEATTRPLRLAYADPPYPGKAAIYRGHPDYAGEVDHAELLSRLAAYDGWALSTSAAALPAVLALAVAQVLPVRVAAWTRPPRPHATARIVNGWEPVIYVPTRRFSRGDASRGPVVDVLAGVAPRRRPTLPTAVIGMKSPAFAEWVFQLLGATPGDSLDDLFPGSGLIARSWSWYVGVDPSRVDVDARRLELVAADR